MAAARSSDSLLREGTRRLARVSESARLDCELLLAHALGLDRTALYGHAAEQLQSGAVARFDALLEERASGRPLAQILGRREFYSLEFEISRQVLVPRPETELLVDVVREGVSAGDRKPRILDLGTGCGAVAVALARTLPESEVVAADISHAALAVARRNAAGLAPGRVRFAQGSWYDPLHGRRFDAIACNPPYVESALCGEPPLCFEPRQALDGGPDGLQQLRLAIAGAPAHLNRGGMLAAEHGADQGAPVRSLMRSAGFEAAVTHSDLAGHERVTAARIP